MVGLNMVFVVYKTDSLHSYASRDIIGIADNVFAAIRICKEQARKEFEEINEEQEDNLLNIYQTQGYSGDGEFHFESVNVNTLL